MKRIFWTIDIECHDINKKNTYIDGKLSNGDNCGLEHILQLAYANNIPVNCFLDIPEALRYGDQYIIDIIDLIHKYNQKVYLHLHPDYISNDSDRSFLWQYDYNEKLGILRKGFNLYSKFLGKEVSFFRIGRYGADEDMYKALRDMGVKITDLSYSFNNPHMCHVNQELIAIKNKVGLFYDQTVMPNTRFCGFSLGKKKWCFGLDFSETTINEFDRFFKRTTLDSLVITMHSWNFIKKYFFLDNYLSRSRDQEKRFVKIVQLAKQKGFVFSDLETTPPLNDDSPDEFIDLCDSFWGKIMMFPNNFIRFFRIAALDKKYFTIYAVFFVLCFMMLAFVLKLALC